MSPYGQKFEGYQEVPAIVWRPAPRRVMPPAIHTSGKTARDECPRRWALGDRDWGLHYQPRFTPSPLFIGQLIHDTLFLYYHRGWEPMEAFGTVGQAMVDKVKANAPGGELWEEERESLRSDLALSQGMISGYIGWQDDVGGREEWGDQKLEFLEMERSFHITYLGVPIAGRFDGLARRRDTGELVLIERKTCRSIPELKGSLLWDLQPKVYAAAAEIVFGEEVHYVLYDMLQKANPYAVPLLQSGLPSRAKSNVTTLPAYLDILSECMAGMGLSDEAEERVMADYADHLQYLAANPPTLYERWVYPVNVAEKEWALRSMVQAYRDATPDWQAIQDGTWPSKVDARLSRFRCPMYCPFKQVCAEMNRGGPWQLLLDNNFVQGMDEEDMYDDGAE